MALFDSSILVFGRHGQLAQSLRPLLPGATFIGHDECNFQEGDAAVMAALSRHRPRLVVNAAAYTQVDKAESEAEKAMRVNAEAPGWIAEWCSASHAALIHVSTDYVYSGEGERPWRENDPTGPLNVYGISKLAGEERIRASGCRHLILRTSWVFSPYGANFVKTMLKLREKDFLKVVDDQVGSPTYAPDLAKVIAILLRGEAMATSGTFHVCNDGETSWFGLAQAIFARLAERGFSVPEIVPIPSREYPTPARRPLNSRLDTSAVFKRFGLRLRPWQDALNEALDILV
jgi:dTDP-4-dehydrorhamnose reductase